MLFRLVAADLRTVLKKNIITFIAIAAVTVANLVYAYGLSSVYGVRTDTLGFADNLALVFAGSAPFEPRPGVMFVPPLGWLFLILLILYTTSHSAYSLYNTRLSDRIVARVWFASACSMPGKNPLVGLAFYLGGGSNGIFTARGGLLCCDLELGGELLVQRGHSW